MVLISPVQSQESGPEPKATNAQNHSDQLEFLSSSMIH